MTKKAFTLIELLVAVSIITIVFSVGIAGYREFSRRQALSGTLKQIKGDLRLAQQLALTGQKPEGAVCGKLYGYTFTRIGSDTYRLVANCDLSNLFTVKEVNLPEYVEISAGSVTFKVLGQGTNLVDNLIYTVTNRVSETNGTITVGVGGDIQ